MAIARTKEELVKAKASHVLFVFPAKGTPYYESITRSAMNNTKHRYTMYEKIVGGKLMAVKGQPHFKNDVSLVGKLTYMGGLTHYTTIYSSIEADEKKRDEDINETFHMLVRDVSDKRSFIPIYGTVIVVTTLLKAHPTLSTGKFAPRKEQPVPQPRIIKPVTYNCRFIWSTVKELIQDDYPHRVEHYQSLVEDGYIELNYREVTGRNPAWYYWFIRSAEDNSKWLTVSYKSGSPMEMEWCQQLPEEMEDE